MEPLFCPFPPTPVTTLLKKMYESPNLKLMLLLSRVQDLCTAALQFASETLKPGGHFVCKFYQGTEDKKLEKQLRKMFDRVCREKPEASRAVSLAALLVCARVVNLLPPVRLII